MFLLLPFVFGLLLQHTSGVSNACIEQNSPCGCSYRPAITSKIVGGEVAASHRWKWIVSLRVFDTHFCGGTILNEWFIITAAHCLRSPVAALANITVCAGIDKLSDICSQSVVVDSGTAHHGLNERIVVNDIALLRLATPLNFSDPFVDRICLPNTTHPFDYPATGTSVIAIGWGSTRIDGKATNELKQISLKIVHKSARVCASMTFDNRLQLCAYAPGRGTCRGDSGGPLMALTASKQWELVGVASYVKECGGHEYSSGYTRVTAYEEFIQQAMNGTYTKPIPRQCTCQCPYGDDQGVAYTSENSPEGCVTACITSSAGKCIRFNTYACLGTDCVYSSSYINSSSSALSGLHRCSCQCPHGSHHSEAYASKNTLEACVNACIAGMFNPCTRDNTYACLGANCTYSSGRVGSTVPAMVGQYRCSCQCPYGDDQGAAYATTNSSEACVDACIGVSSNRCIRANTYACLGTSCVYSSDYSHSPLSTALQVYRCACECPYGNNQGEAFAKENSTEACVCACRAALNNRCVGHNTYACLGTNCAYSSTYNYSSAVPPSGYRCSCQCPYGNNQGWAYASDNSSAACVEACRAVSSNPCNSENTYACLGTDCAFSISYLHRCSCQCPFGSIRSLTHMYGNTTEACVNACVAIASNDCTHSNTYACLEDRCAYSSSYDNSSTTASTRYRCACQCPYGTDQGLAFTKRNSSEACVDACTAVSSNRCIRSNTYACLGTSCVYSSDYVNSTLPAVSYRYRCSCQCPYGSDQGGAYATDNSATACVSACIGVSTNRCIRSNTYACLGTSCVYSSDYLNSTLPSVMGQYRCSCQCPYRVDQGWAYATDNSSTACVDACRAVSSNPCNSGNTYACLGTDCAFSTSYLHRCSCQCPFGSIRSLTHMYGNTTEACVNACVAIASNDCTHSNTYACLEDRCAYSSSYDNSSTIVPTPYRCACHCPHDTYQGVVLSRLNSTEACVNACIAASRTLCRTDNTYACLESSCAYSDSYQHSSTTVAPRYRCTCQCPYGHDEGLAYTTENSPQGCVDACQAIPSNPCIPSNTYACLGPDCLYSSAYSNTSVTARAGYKCGCQCPYGSDEGVAYANENSANACVTACQAVPWNSCDNFNTYACREDDDCVYSSFYVH